MEIKHDELTLSSLNKEYKFQLGKDIKIHDTYGRFILRIGKEKLIFYKFMLGKKELTKNDIDQLTYKIQR